MVMMLLIYCLKVVGAQRGSVLNSGSWDTQFKPGRDHGTTRAHRTGPPGHRFWILGHPPQARPGPRDHAGTPNGATGPPILDPGTPTPSQAGTTGPRGHTKRGTRATDSGSGDTHPKPGRDHGTTRAHQTGPPGHRFWIRGHPPQARPGPRDHAGTPNGAPEPPILDPGTPTPSQAGTTGPRGHTKRGH